MEPGQTVTVRGMSGTILQIKGDLVLVEAQRPNGSFVNIWVKRAEIAQA